MFSVILLYFMFLHFILYCGQLYTVVSAAYSAELSSSYFERINDDDDDDDENGWLTDLIG